MSLSKDCWLIHTVYIEVATEDYKRIVATSSLSDKSVLSWTQKYIC